MNEDYRQHIESAKRFWEHEMVPTMKKKGDYFARCSCGIILELSHEFPSFHFQGIMNTQYGCWQLELMSFKLAVKLYGQNG